MTRQELKKEESKEKDPFKIVWNIVTWVLIGIIVLIAVALVGVRLFGLKPYTVLSGSMEPTYKTGSVVYVKKVDYKTLEVGDPITFMLDEKTVATHRIVDIIPDDEDPNVLRFKTKGDNNDSADAKAVHCKNIIGKPVFSIPVLGYVSNYIQNPPGLYIMIAVVAVMAILSFLPDLLNKGNKDKKNKEEEISE